MKLKILYRYILGQILKTFFVILAGIVVFIFISNLIDEAAQLQAYKPSLILVMGYFLLKTPFLAAEAAPFAILLSTLFVFSQFNRFNELNAMKSAGIDFYSIVKPVLLLALGFSIGIIVINETLISRACEKATYIKEVLIEKKGPAGEIRSDLAKLSSGGKVFYIRLFDSLLGTMKGACVLTLDKDFNLTERIDAREGIWQKDRWVLSNVYVRTYKGGIEQSSLHQDKYEVFTKDTPSDFVVHKRSPEDTLTINIFRLHKLIDFLKESGFNYNEELTNFHLKIAFPFASFILALLGVSLPFLFPTTRSIVNVALGFVITIVVAFFYMGFVTIGLSLGKVAVMPPVLAAWMANIVFAALGFLILSRIKK
jgi:lipopolysaccharide export system permease protein